jgi:dihydropyrimidinase
LSIISFHAIIEGNGGGGVKDLLVKDGYAVAETGEGVLDILCSGGKIARMGKGLPVPAGAEVIGAAGKIVIPGGVDVHTHLNLDVGSAVASDDFYTGTVAAAFGGTTTIVDHPAFGPAGCSLDHQIKQYHGLAAGRAVIDYAFHGVIQHVDPDVLSKMEDLAEEGITSYKVYLTYGFKIPDEGLYRVLKRAGELGLLVTVHPENDGVVTHLRETFVREGKRSPAFHPLSRPPECEAEAINRMILLARMAGDAPLYIVHLTCALGLEFIGAARRRGQRRLFAETCPQYLFLDEGLYRLPGIEGLKYLMCPPLRGEADRESLWRGLEADIDTVATDHCPFFFETQKVLGRDDFTRCPSGAPGIEERIPLMYAEGVAKKRISLRRFVDLCCTNPARLFGLYPRKGALREGSDADIVIIDPDRRAALHNGGPVDLRRGPAVSPWAPGTLHENVDYTAYEGMELSGYPVCTISRGEVLVRDGEFHAAPGRGQYISRGRPRL